MFDHIRHRPPSVLARERELVLACAPLRTRANLSSIVRTAGCCGITRVIACGNAKVDPDVARDSLEQVGIEVRRTLPPVLRDLRSAGYRVVGLEQTTNSRSLHSYPFPRKTALAVGNERLGLTEEELKFVDDCVEIPVWGMPHSYNVATATAMALYEYCKQYPEG
ncbi:RNA methyltransferase [Streptomyces synnematoformans]|uniref:TrmH family RNA methyltransferase n=1 Tax=Streptomyces synnematoformans TaxID=415721 RepID=UPI0031D151AA